MESTKIFEIENRVAIAADAALSVNAYLEELNYKLVSVGVNNALSICQDTEEIIVEVLLHVGSEKKLGADVVMQLIHEELGTPDLFIKQYLENNDGSNYESQNRENSKILLKREKTKVKWDRNRLFARVARIFKGIITLLLHIIEFSPVILLTLAMTYILMNGFYDTQIFSTILIAVGALIYSIIEIKSAVSGKLVLTMKDTKMLRSYIRGLLLGFTVIALHELNLIGLYSVIYINGNLYNIVKAEYFYNDMYAYYDMLHIVIFCSILLLTIESIILIRDHKSGLYPLEPEFKHKIRYLTPPYLLLFTSIILTIFNVFVLSIVLPVIAFIYAKQKKYSISPRFAILIFLSQFLASRFAYQLFNSEIYFIFLLYYPIYFMIQYKEKRHEKKMFQQSEKKLHPKFSKDLFAIREKLNEYFAEKDHK